MSDYTQSTFFAPKDLLATGNPNKIIYGSDVDAELSAISTAIATKADVNGDAIGAGTPCTELSVDNLKLDGNKIISTDTNGDIELEPDGTGSVIITKVDVADGEIDGTPIGANSASTGAFTTLTASGDVNFDSGTFFVDASADAVGIGTSSPAVDLQVGNGSGLYQASISGGGYDLILGASGGNLFGYASQSISAVFNIASVPLGIGTNGSQPLILGTDATERARIDAVGNVGIGTTNPGEKLAVHGDSGNIVGVFETSTGNTNRLWLGATSTESYIDATAGVGATNMVFKVASTERARIDSSGSLTVAGGDTTFNGSGFFKHVGTYSRTTASAANLFIFTDGQFYRSTSSARYKNSIEDASYGLSDVMSLRPVTYKGNNDGDTVYGGLVAEEVHDAGLGEFVQYDEQGRPDALAYGNMVSLCIKAIQEQQEIIEDLRARVAALEA